MRFGAEPTESAEGAVLAHTLRLGAEVLKKGRILGPRELAAIASAGLSMVTTVRLDTTDIGEDEVARELGVALGGTGILVEKASTGRVNLLAAEQGLLVFDRDAIDRLNLLTEDVTVATLMPQVCVEPGQLVASIKIIPFAVHEPVVVSCLTAALSAKLHVHRFQALSATLIQTVRPGDKTSVLEKTAVVTASRLSQLGCRLAAERRCAHNTADLAKAIADTRYDTDLLLIVGSSAIVDRRDVIPAAIESVGGRIERFGMPADPGNLILIAHIGDQPVLGLPGCARSPAPSGLDWVLRRLAARLPVQNREIARMGVGGLLIGS